MTFVDEGLKHFELPSNIPSDRFGLVRPKVDHFNNRCRVREYMNSFSWEGTQKEFAAFDTASISVDSAS